MSERKDNDDTEAVFALFEHLTALGGSHMVVALVRRNEEGRYIEISDVTSEPLLAELYRHIRTDMVEIAGHGERNGVPWQCWCDEEGKLKGKTVNIIATAMLEILMPGFSRQDFLVGNVVFLIGHAAQCK